MAYNKYQEGKIYLIRSPSRPDIDPYYGSTINTLKHRFDIHKCDANKRFDCSSKILIDCGDAIIELVEDYPCENKRELLVREGLYIKNNKCINRRNPGQTKKEYRDKNKKMVIEWGKKYREKNKDKQKIYNIEYYEQNKEKIIEKNKEKYTCICGSIIRHGSKARHERTQRHINYISTIDI